MQRGDRPLIQVSVRRENGKHSGEWIVVAKVGYFTTVELTIPQMLTLLESLSTIKESWYEDSLQRIPIKQPLTPSNGR
jgi:hypothetical protein